MKKERKKDSSDIYNWIKSYKYIYIPTLNHFHALVVATLSTGDVGDRVCDEFNEFLLLGD